MNVPRAWASCESCHSNGRLVGIWVDAVDAGDLTAEQVHAGSGVDWRTEGCEVKSRFTMVLTTVRESLRI
ncbi:hypothetical protein GCM10023217_03660 [Gordonia alkaliphila]|uniref:Uncharacterized protein n=1 Tax=Gordonia alkaliphila TaxID=1053547 RepID=A0ABP8YVZ1_9ACTN